MSQPPSTWQPAAGSLTGQHSLNLLVSMLQEPALCGACG